MFKEQHIVTYTTDGQARLPPSNPNSDACWLKVLTSTLDCSKPVSSLQSGDADNNTLHEIVVRLKLVIYREQLDFPRCGVYYY